MNLDDVKKLTQKTLSAQLAAYGFDDVIVSAGKDHDEDDALFMTAKYKSGSALPSGDVLNRTLAILRRELQKAGEERFPYLTHSPEGEETGYDDEDAPE
uniref:Uncharacterized protein n=1 Tax=Rhodopseudomonas palustris (strain BisA53) TaxID=316055 RepID=Q07UD0_RHOP5